jgi:hypothetical protein
VIALLPGPPAGGLLAPLEQAKALLAAAHSVDVVKTIHDQAEAMRVYATQARMGLEAQNHAAEIKLRAERRAGELLAAMAKNRGTLLGGHTVLPPGPEPRLADLAISKMQSSRWQRVAAIPPAVFEQHIAAVKAAGEELTSAGLLRGVRDPSLAVHFSSDSPEWSTPPDITRWVVQVLGAIDLDPCARSHDRPTVPAARRFTAADDGLAQRWAGRVYMNPPYGPVIGAWVSKLVAAYQCGAVTAAIALVPARTDTAWFGELGGCALCFIAGRLRFSGAEHGAPFPSVAAYLGMDREAFAAVFRALGPIWIAWAAG